MSAPRTWAELEHHIEGWPHAEEIPPGPKLNLGSGELVLPDSDGWVNLDIARDPGVSVLCDLFRFPWPIRARSMSYVMCCNMAEHIPHALGCREDGWFRFFREIHRVLVPGGRCCVISPYAFTWGAFQDPTHVRFIVPSTFAYLRGPDGGATSSGYATGYRFDAEVNLASWGRTHDPDLPESVAVNVRADLTALVD